jgi:CBS domain-containing protein
MRVSELMITDVKAATPDMPLTDALRLLSEEHVSALPVVDLRNRLVGVFSTTDVLQAMAESEDPEARERLFGEGMVRDLMTPKAVTVTFDVSVKEAAQQMLYLELHRLFVVDGERLVGVLSQSDIVRGVALARL